VKVDLSSRRAVRRCNDRPNGFFMPILIGCMFVTSLLGVSPICQILDHWPKHAKKTGGGTRDGNLQAVQHTHSSRFDVSTSTYLQIPPRLMVIPKVNTPSHLQIRRDVRIRLGLFSPPSISQPRKSIVRLHIRVLPIFPSRLSPYPCDVGSTAWPQAMDPTTWPSAVGPGTAVLTEHCSREKGIAVFDEIVCRLLLRRDACDVLVGYFAQDLGHECHLRFGCPRTSVRRTTLVNGVVGQLTSMCNRS
jgi:hypothetical protein